MTSTRLRRVASYLPVLLRGRSLHGPERYRPFFIIGSGRCGSTLLRTMLEAHPDVHIPPESALYPMVQDFRRYSRLPWNVVLRIVLARLECDHRWAAWEVALTPVFAELDALPPEKRNLAAVLAALYRAHASQHKPSAIRWGDKTPPNTSKLGALYSVFPDLQAVHLLRDGRDVVQSFLQYSEASLPFWANIWIRAVRDARAFGARHPGQYLEIRYEDLVSDPRATIETVATFLNLAFSERMLRHHELDLRLGDVDQYPSHEGVRQPVYRTSVGRWRTTLNAIQIAQLERLLGPTLATLGYHADAVAP